MHEVGLAAEIHRIARGAADARGGGRLESVTVAIGDLAAVEPDLLEFAWTAIVAGGRDESARLIVDWRPARQLCATCGDVPERAPGSVDVGTDVSGNPVVSGDGAGCHCFPATRYRNR